MPETHHRGCPEPLESSGWGSCSCGAAVREGDKRGTADGANRSDTSHPDHLMGAGSHIADAPLTKFARVWEGPSNQGTERVTGTL